MPTFAELRDQVIDLTTELGNIVVAEKFSGETADAARAKTVEFIQQAQTTASNLDTLHYVESEYRRAVQEFVNTSGVPAQFDDMNEIWYHAGRKKFGALQVVNMTFNNEGHAETITRADGRVQTGVKDLLWLKEGGVDPTYASAVDKLYCTTCDKAIETMRNAAEEINTMPTVVALENGTYKGDGHLRLSLFNQLDGSFQEKDFDTDSPYSALKSDGKSDLTHSLSAATTPSPPKEDEQPKEEKKENDKDDKETNNSNSGSRASAAGARTSIPTGGGFSGAGMQAGRNPSIGWSVNKITGDDIYDSLRERFGEHIPQDEIDKAFEKAGYGSEKEYKEKYSPTSTVSSYTPTSYTPKEYEPVDYTPTRTSNDISTGTSSYTPSSYTPANYTPSTTGASYTPASTTSGRTIPANEFSSMMNQLREPITTRGATGAPGAAGASAPAMRAGSGGSPGPVATGAGNQIQRGSTAGTGESSAGASRGVKSGNVAAGGAAGPARMGGMGMMPMGAMGGPGGGGGGKSSTSEKKKGIKNQDGDLYGNDVKSVSPIISAGGQAFNNSKEKK